MDDLDYYRSQVDEIDKQMIKLFEERMNMVLKIAEYKNNNNLPIFHKDREKEVIEKNVNRLQNKELEKYTVKFIKDLMNVSKEYQHEKMGVCENIKASEKNN